MAKFKVGDMVRWLTGDCVTMTHLKVYRVEWVYKGDADEKCLHQE
jgi:hypothetical protein